MHKLTPKQMEDALCGVAQIENLLQAYDLAIAGKISWGVSDRHVDHIDLSDEAHRQMSAIIAADIWGQIHSELSELHGIGVDTSEIETTLATRRRT